MDLTARRLFTTPDMPPGGSPAWDANYLWWVREYCARINVFWADRNTDRFGEVPPEVGELVNEWQLTNHLFKWLHGGALPDGRWPQWRFKIRVIAIQFRYRGAEFKAEARAYVGRLAAEFRASHPHLTDEPR